MKKTIDFGDMLRFTDIGQRDKGQSPTKQHIYTPPPPPPRRNMKETPKKFSGCMLRKRELRNLFHIAHIYTSLRGVYVPGGGHCHSPTF